MNSRNDERNRVPSQSDGVHTFSLDRCELGVATAATQIEGGHAATNWHRWAEQPGRIKDGSGPWRANDHWNRVAQDQTLLRELKARIDAGMQAEPHAQLAHRLALCHHVGRTAAAAAATVTILCRVQ